MQRDEKKEFKGAVQRSRGDSNFEEGLEQRVPLKAPKQEEGSHGLSEGCMMSSELVLRREEGKRPMRLPVLDPTAQGGSNGYQSAPLALAPRLGPGQVVSKLQLSSSTLPSHFLTASVYLPHEVGSANPSPAGRSDPPYASRAEFIVKLEHHLPATPVADEHLLQAQRRAKTSGDGLLSAKVAIGAREGEGSRSWQGACRTVTGEQVADEQTQAPSGTKRKRTPKGAAKNKNKSSSLATSIVSKGGHVLPSISDATGEQAPPATDASDEDDLVLISEFSVEEWDWVQDHTSDHETPDPRESQGIKLPQKLMEGMGAEDPGVENWIRALCGSLELSYGISNTAYQLYIVATTAKALKKLEFHPAAAACIVVACRVDHHYLKVATIVKACNIGKGDLNQRLSDLDKFIKRHEPKWYLGSAEPDRYIKHWISRLKLPPFFSVAATNVIDLCQGAGSLDPSAAATAAAAIAFVSHFYGRPKSVGEVSDITAVRVTLLKKVYAAIYQQKGILVTKLGSMEQEGKLENVPDAANWE